jgi:ferredoxin-NADP reductase
VVVGDELEVRGPIGGWFVWEQGPALLVGGGSGVVPLMSMLRHARVTGRSDDLRVVVSVRTLDDLVYADELPGPEVTVLATRVRPEGRLQVADLAPLVRPDQTAYVCGSSRFADPTSHLLVEAGVPVERIRVERFGPTG